MTKEELLQIPFYIEDISGSANTVTIKKNNSSAPTLTLEYSTDGSTWATKTMNSTTTANTFELPANGKLYLRGVNNGWCNSGSQDKYNYITASGQHNIGGNIMSLLHGSNFIGKISFPTTNTFVLCNLFYQNTTLVNAQDLQLPATTLAVRCYRYMFNGCSNLTTAPELPATTLAGYCYTFMFYNCTSLTTAPSILPATNLSEYCYASMFKGCTSLTTVPSILPATTLMEGCYDNMFYNCSSLTITPELPATTLSRYCYYHMFDGCSSLTIAPELPATTLVDSCYQYMFNGCSKLNYIKADFISHSSSYFTNWVNGVSSTGTFVMNPDANYNPANIRGVNGIPSGWDVYTFNLKQRKINIISNNTSYGTVIGNGIYNIGETATLTAVPTYKGKFVSWNDGNTELTRTIEITEDLPYESTYTATFEEVHGIYFINESENTNILTVTNTDKVLQYSIDNVNWNNIANNTTTTIEFEDVIIIKGTNTSLDGVNFKNSELILIEGNIMTLLHGDNITTIGNVFPEGSVNTFKGLFKDNVNLVDISKLELPETTVEGCYSSMFQGCSSLVNAPTLPATTLATSCYQEMFNGCTSLEKTPALSATTLVTSCYEGMFSGCTQLTVSPTLPATTLATSCYENMFSGCSNLNNITVNLIPYTNANNEFSNWVNGVSEEGTLYLMTNISYNIETIRGVNGIPEGWNVSQMPNYFYIEDISGSENTVSITKASSSARTLNLEYSIDGSEWITVTMNSGTTANTFTIPANGKLYFRGVNNYWGQKYNYSPVYAKCNMITCSGNHNVGGNIMSLLYGSDFKDKTEFPTTGGYEFYYLFKNNTTLVNSQKLQLPATTLNSYCYSYMFANCTSLTTTPKLPATTLAEKCYCGMFYNCSSLTTAPELPATTLANSCYQYMFQDCTSLIIAPELPAKYLPLQCYYSMFSFCTSLTTAPELPAKYLDEWCCFQMFRNCTSLTTAPELSGTMLSRYCYKEMFYDCSNLTTAPSILPATTLYSDCYVGMFGNCTSLTKAPELPATTLADWCYGRMFANCSKLNYIKADFINYDSNCFSGWVEGVSSTGLFVMNPEATYDIEQIRGVDGIPTGWTVVTKIYTDTHVYIVNKSKNLNSLIINNNSSDLQYLVDIATEWVTLPTSKEPQRIEFQYGITLKGNNTSLNGCKIKTSNESTLNGNIMALLYGDDYENKVTFPEGSKNTFKYLFLGYNKCLDIINLQLPATTLAPHCYQHMFTGCTSLTKIPTLPAQNLTNSCYHGMFMDCDGIDKVRLLETYLAPYAYSNMFLGSDNLSNVIVTYNENVDETNYKGWLKGVKTNGKFSYNNTGEVDNSIIKINYHVPDNWDIKYFDPNAINYFYVENISGEENTVCISNRMGLIGEIAWEETVEESLRPYMPINLEYSYDKITWENVIFPELTSDESSWYAQVPLPKDGIVYFRNLDTYCNPALQIISELGITPENDYWDYMDDVDYFSYLFSYNINVINDGNIGGDIRTLSNGMDIENTPNNDIYYSLFASIWGYDNLLFENKIISAENLILPATTLVVRCYSYMFSDCSSLTTAPELPATTLADYCYQGMFSGCSSLTTAPELPVTTLAEVCYDSMFSGCSSLTTAPELPATTLYGTCYQGMFSGCSSLTTAPELPATTLAVACYNYMFEGCTSLTTAPELPATTLADYCYHGMFAGCSSLTTAPELPATTLVINCYATMFTYCSNLTTAPELPATTLVMNCYTQMFYGCSKLNYIKADFINYSPFNNKQELANWVSGVSNTGTFVMNPNATYNPDSIRGVDGIPSGWTVLTSEE